jgi:hypothetical protein
LLYDWCTVLVSAVPSQSVWYIGEVTRPVPAIQSYQLWTVLGHMLCLRKQPGLCLESACLPYAAGGPHFVYYGHQFVSALHSSTLFYLLEAFISVDLSVLFFWNCLLLRDQARLQSLLLLHYFPYHCAVNSFVLTRFMSYLF